MGTFFCDRCKKQWPDVAFFCCPKCHPRWALAHFLSMVAAGLAICFAILTWLLRLTP